jgi:hypothetical protein
MRVPILARWSQPNTVVERSFEAIEVGSDDIYPLIGNQARQALPHALAHDAGLAVMHRETLFAQYDGDMRREPVNSPV